MSFAGSPSHAEIDACVASLREATVNLERLSPVALAALARAAGRFVRAAKQLRRQRGRGRRRGEAEHPGLPAALESRRVVASASPRRAEPGPAEAPAQVRRRASAPRRCYVCHARFVERRSVYASLCPACAAYNLAKRVQTADLSGRVALVTGARVTSGHAAALKLLRAGAVVIGTTRFPGDAAARFAAEPDFRAWAHRLHLYGIDLRSPTWVEAFAEHLRATLHRLDVLINNAAQTIRRPAPFYAALARTECDREVDREGPLGRVLASGRAFLASRGGVDDGTGRAGARLGALSAMLSQVPVLPEDTAALVPAGEAGIVAAGDGVRDERASNSWMLRLDEVRSEECLEAMLVNAVAPCLLAGRLRALMAREATADKWIVNVAAVEGQFSRRHKDGRHAHLDMAKAALNMMTRSAAADYARDRIYMNSVDVGWFSNGEPAAVAAAMRDRGFTLPLDETDAAARICDPIFSGVRTGHNTHGKLLKDYCPVAW